MAPVTKGIGWEPLPDVGRTLFPEVSERTAYGSLGGQVALDTLDPFRVRTEFLKLDVSNTKATLEFLEHVGLWSMNGWAPANCQRISDVWAGYRLLNGCAIPTSAGELHREQKRCTEMLDLLRRDPTALSERFGPPSSLVDALNARGYNTLQLHMEWRHGKPQGVIQPVTLTELLHTTLHVDMLTHAKPQICERHDCGVRFTGRVREYCTDECARVVATRAWRQRKRQAKEVQQIWRSTNSRRRKTANAKRSNRKNH